MSPRAEDKERICCRSKEPIQSATGYLLMVPEIMRMIETQEAGVTTSSHVRSSPGPDGSQVGSSPLKKAASSCEVQPCKKPFSGKWQRFIPLCL